jgi:hypothetical protein
MDRQKRKAQRIADNANAFDERGILKDGHSFRVPLMMHDAQRLEAATEAARQRNLSGSEQISLQDIRRITEEKMQRNERAFFDQYRPHLIDYDRSASNAAYAEMCTELQDQWKSKDAGYTPAKGTQAPITAPVGAAPMPATRGDASVGDAKPGTREFVDQEWRRMVEDQRNAWRS